jgi:hypothetical protein
MSNEYNPYGTDYAFLNNAKFDRQDPMNIRKYQEKHEAQTKKKQKEVLASIATMFFNDNFIRKKREVIQKQMKRNDMLMIFFAFAGIILNILSSNYYITFDKQYGIFL